VGEKYDFFYYNEVCAQKSSFLGFFAALRDMEQMHHWKDEDDFFFHG